MATALLKLTDVQLGTSVTATNNFTWYQPSTPDGTVRLGNGNSGSATDIMTLTSAGNVGINTSSPNIAGYGAGSTVLTLKSTSGSQRSALELFNHSAGATSALGSVDFGTGSSRLAQVSGTADGAVDSANIRFLTTATGGSLTERMRLDSSGNLGLGVTPSAWYTTYKALQMAGGSLFTYSGNDRIGLAQNKYVGSASQYVNNGYASEYLQLNGEHRFYTAPSGTAGNAITFTQAMTLDASGRLGVGTTSPSYKLVAYTAGTTNVIASMADAGQTAYLSVCGNGTAPGSTAFDLIQAGAGDSYIYNRSNGFMAFGTNNTERMRIDSSGNVGIGTSSPLAKLHVGAGADTPIVAATAIYASNAGSTVITARDSTNDVESYIGSYSTGTWLGAASNHPAIFVTNNTERMRIDSSGNLLVGGTTASGKFVVTGAVGNAFIPSDGNGITFTRNAANYVYANGGSTATVVVISNTNGVVLNNGATSWSAFSDERTKDIIEPIENAAEKVSILRAVIGKYKTDEEGKRRSFLIAQDVQAVLPEAVAPITQEDGSEVLGLSYTDTIPLLVAAIKEQQAIIESLTKRIETLEGA